MYAIRSYYEHGEQAPAYRYHSLAYGKKNRNLEPFLVEFEARQCRITSYNVCYTKLLRGFPC